MRWLFSFSLLMALASPAPCGVDVNSCTYSELLSLPGVGPRLATAILEDHAANGDFRGPEDLDRVKGVGPAMLRRLAPLVEFGKTPGGKVRSACATEPATSSVPPIDVNTATAGMLEQLPGLGAVLAARIVERRIEKGAFRSVEDLGLVKGLGPKKAKRLAPLLGLK